MRYIPTLWKANIIAFISSFCVMVIELIAARMLVLFTDDHAPTDILMLPLLGRLYSQSLWER